MPRKAKKSGDTDVCFSGFDELKNYYSFRVRNPSLFLEGNENWASRPGWSIPVVKSIVDDSSFIVSGRLKSGSNEWKLQSVRVLKEGRSEKEAAKIARRIIEKVEKRTCV